MSKITREEALKRLRGMRLIALDPIEMPDYFENKDYYDNKVALIKKKNKRIEDIIDYIKNINQQTQLSDDVEEALDRIETNEYYINVNGKCTSIGYTLEKDVAIIKSKFHAMQQEIVELKKTAIWALGDCMLLNEQLPHPSASDDFVYNKKLTELKKAVDPK